MFSGQVWCDEHGNKSTERKEVPLADDLPNTVIELVPSQNGLFKHLRGDSSGLSCSAKATLWYVLYLQFVFITAFEKG